eukprot:Selendium_serpulae@DN11598_c0_g1_i1.p2
MSDYLSGSVPLERSVFLSFQLMGLVLHRISPAIHTFISRLGRTYSDPSGGELVFALPWLFTWFAHSLPSYEQTARLLDCCLVLHPAFPLYFAAAVAASDYVRERLVSIGTKPKCK